MLVADDRRFETEHWRLSKHRVPREKSRSIGSARQQSRVFQEQCSSLLQEADFQFFLKSFGRDYKV